MPGNITRYNVEAPGNTIFAANYNGELDNIIDNGLTCPGVDDYSADASEMQTQTAPTSGGSVSLATSLAGEIERLRFQIAAILGSEYWYETPTTNLQSQSAISPVFVTDFEGTFGGGSSTTDALAKLINNGGIVNALSESSLDVVAGDFDSSNVKFNTYSLALSSDCILGFSGSNSNPIKGAFSTWFRNLAAGDYLLYNPLLGIEVFLDGSGYLTTRITEAAATAEDTKATTTVAGSSSRAGDTDWQQVVSQWRLNDEGGGSTDLVQQYLDGAAEGAQVSSDDIDISKSGPGIFYVGAGPNNPTWDHNYAANGAPSAHSDAWTETGNTNDSVSGGVLNIAPSSVTGSNYWSKSNNIDLTNFTFEFKTKLNSVSERTSRVEDRIMFGVRDDSRDESFFLGINDGFVILGENAIGASANVLAEIRLNTKEYHVYRMTADAGALTLYIDGRKVYSNPSALTGTDSAASDIILFGGSDGGTWSADYDIEYIRYFDGGAEAPLAGSSQGNLDSVALVSDTLAASTITALQTVSASNLFPAPEHTGVSLPPIINRDLNGNESHNSASSVDYQDFSPLFTYVVGDGSTEYEATFALPVENNTAGAKNFIAIDVGGDIIETYPNGGMSFVDQAVADEYQQLVVTRRFTPGVGITLVQAKWRADSGVISTDSTYSEARLLRVNVVKTRKL